MPCQLDICFKIKICGYGCFNSLYYQTVGLPGGSLFVLQPDYCTTALLHLEPLVFIIGYGLVLSYSASRCCRLG